jgi:NAD dependent epimerase/dehydratase family enzyme
VFRLGLGARLGDGRQRMPMISLRDWVGAVAHLVESEDVSGPVNLSSPQTPSNAEFTQALAHAVGRRALVVAPRFALEKAAGPMAPEVLGSINLRPAVLERSGYRFRDRTVDEVVRSGLG